MELIASLGVIPRSLEILNRQVFETHVIPFQSPNDDDQNQIHLWILTAARLFSNSAQSIYAPGIGQTLALLKNSVNKYDSVAVNSLFSHFLNGTPLAWNSVFNGHSLQSFGNIGLVYIQKVEGEKVYIFLPHFLLSMFCNNSFDWNQLEDPYTFSLLSSIAHFPVSIDGISFERLILGLVVVRIRTLFRSGIEQCTLSQLFPGAENSQILSTNVKLKSIKFGREKFQFIISSNKKQNGDDDDDDDEDKEQEVQSEEEKICSNELIQFKFKSFKGKKKVKIQKEIQLNDLVQQTHLTVKNKLIDGLYASLTRENTALVDGRLVLECVDSGQKPLLLLFQMKTSY